MLCVSVTMEYSEGNSKNLRMKVATGVHNLRLRHRMLPMGENWILRIVGWIKSPQLNRPPECVSVNATAMRALSRCAGHAPPWPSALAWSNRAHRRQALRYIRLCNASEVTSSTHPHTNYDTQHLQRSHHTQHPRRSLHTGYTRNSIFPITQTHHSVHRFRFPEELLQLVIHSTLTAHASLSS